MVNVGQMIQKAHKAGNQSQYSPTPHSKQSQQPQHIPKNMEIKYKKDMQQLKFYQTLNNYTQNQKTSASQLPNPSRNSVIIHTQLPGVRKIHEQKQMFSLPPDVEAQAQEITKGFDNVNFPSQHFMQNSMEQRLDESPVKSNAGSTSPSPSPDRRAINPRIEMRERVPPREAVTQFETSQTQRINARNSLAMTASYSMPGGNERVELTEQSNLICKQMKMAT